MADIGAYFYCVKLNSPRILETEALTIITMGMSQLDVGDYRTISDEQ